MDWRYDTSGKVPALESKDLSSSPSLTKKKKKKERKKESNIDNENPSNGHSTCYRL
jgi:hypothetical protein